MTTSFSGEQFLNEKLRLVLNTQKRNRSKLNRELGYFEKKNQS